jgi:hypothetical protein
VRREDSLRRTEKMIIKKLFTDVPMPMYVCINNIVRQKVERALVFKLQIVEIVRRV